MIILEDCNFVWQTKHLDKAQEMWEQGASIIDIAKELKRDPDEVFLLLLHLARQNKVKRRPVNIYGR